MIDLRTLQRALGGEISAGQLLCPGPDHSAADRSLSVKLDDSAPDGFLVHSFAGDDPIACKDHVRQKLGLPAFKTNGGNGGRRASNDAIERALMAAVQGQRVERRKGRLIATHDYVEANGTLVYQVLRYEQPKGFLQRRPDGRGGWILKLDGVRRVLYRLPELLKYPDGTVFVCEGEKDVDRVAALGHCATTVAHGTWTDDCVKALAGRHIIVLEDNDKAGRKKAREAAELLHGVAADVRVVSLPGLAEKEDVSDWLDASRLNTVDELLKISFDTPLWTPGTEADQDKDADARQDDADTKEQTKPDGPRSHQATTSMERLKTMKFEPIKYVVPGIIVEGLTLIAGKPKIGKSWLLLHAAIAVARSGFTLGEIHCPEGDVLYCALEDNLRRLQSRGIKLLGHSQDWPRRLEFWCELPRLAIGGLDQIKAWIEAATHPRLIIIDTLAMVRAPKKKDQTQYDADYAAVLELRKLANEYGIAVVLVHHLRKQDADDAYDAVSGTLGLTGAVDTVLVLKRESNGTIVLHGRGRDLIEVEKVMTFNKDACTWIIAGEASEVRVSTERKAVLDAMEKIGVPASPNEIATEAELKSANVRRMLERMAREGAIQRCERGKYSLPAAAPEVA
jgi:AAA domain/Toprim-like